MPDVNLNQVTFPSTNIERSIAFYRGMGFTLIVESPHYARFECPDGDATFSCHIVDAEPAASEFTVYFESDNLDELVTRLKDQGYQIDQDPQDEPWLWREARLRDLDGNSICLFHAGDNRKNPAWRVKSE
jgi:catechol 2,3-dioxygenase-like lactoylglutathione lyase family enzyme